MNQHKNSRKNGIGRVECVDDPKGGLDAFEGGVRVRLSADEETKQGKFEVDGSPRGGQKNFGRDGGAKNLDLNL